jgi:hypothetical protein
MNWLVGIAAFLVTVGFSLGLPVWRYIYWVKHYQDENPHPPVAQVITIIAAGLLLPGIGTGLLLSAPVTRGFLWGSVVATVFLVVIALAGRTPRQPTK